MVWHRGIGQRGLIGLPVATFTVGERAPGFDSVLPSPRLPAPTAAVEAFASMCASWARLFAQNHPAATGWV